jgi:hypothetical protein
VPFGCSKDSVKPSEDSLLAQGALRALERIEESYENRELQSVKNMIDPVLFRKIEDGPRFDKALLVFSPARLVKIDSNYVTIVINWQGTWTSDGEEAKNRGASNIVFDRDSMKVLRIDGDNPFIAPSAANGKN